MRFLVDNQLPEALARFLRERGFEARHVLEVSLDHVSDREIVAFAVLQNFTIITKDQDFSVLAALGQCDASIIWVRLGNCRRTSLLSAFDASLDSIIARLSAGDKLIELLG